MGARSQNSERAPERGAPEIPGSVLTRSGARSHLRSLDAPARSALLGLGAWGGGGGRSLQLCSQMFVMKTV
jgi:hypothetical protein